MTAAQSKPQPMTDERITRAVVLWESVARCLPEDWSLRELALVGLDLHARLTRAESERDAATALLQAHRIRPRGKSTMPEMVALLTERAAAVALLRDLKPEWDAMTKGRIWTADRAGYMASLRQRFDAILAKARP